jgi:hypothetical protein
MPSVSLSRWKANRRTALDELEAAHRGVGGAGPGRRYATQQINHAYTVLLSSQFQGFCRDLHDECADCLVQGISPAPLRAACRNALVQNRRLNQGNPNPGNLGSDFNRFGLVFWDEVKNLDTRNLARQNRLAELNDWRNAIAHQDFKQATPLRLVVVRQWRKACGQLAAAFDEVIRQHVESINGTSPW